ncbi:hypothetical protein PACTADRAFT_51207 [Pachysolen tannophilus NRRL Y-2460]|uniref:Uncharacterized protein n=1 Tax=Pachysolen tannophilus NRRL Y-2460 TaxID=669874 RepID=A0A1E4TRG1_PACTA|nr:hypothetical protein PACTADRAFT_51207 [Pachysolen tannophilus NRRL Y-2460]
MDETFEGDDSSDSGLSVFFRDKQSIGGVRLDNPNLRILDEDAVNKAYNSRHSIGSAESRSDTTDIVRESSFRYEKAKPSSNANFHRRSSVQDLKSKFSTKIKRKNRFSSFGAPSPSSSSSAATATAATAAAVANRSDHDNNGNDVSGTSGGTFGGSEMYPIYTVPTNTTMETSNMFSPASSNSNSNTVHTIDSGKLSNNLRNQNFWKYHIISIGKNKMYLTTNPDIKHLYCRNGPGYFIDLLIPKSDEKDKKLKQSEIGYRLVFKIDDNKEEEPKSCIIVTKEPNSKNSNGDFKISYVSLLDIDVSGKLQTNKNNPKSLNNTAREVDIPELMALAKKDAENLELRQLIPNFHRYQVINDNNQYLIGSKPDIKQKNSNKLKISNHVYKLTNKQNVYFYKDKDLAVKKLSLRNHQQQDIDIIGLFRPHETRLKKKLIKTINATSNTLSSNDVELDITGEASSDPYSANSTSYYKSGDGFFIQNPKDDSPNDTKIGWITIYEDHDQIFKDGLWELVLGYTFAIGFERIIDDYLKTDLYNF